MRVSDCDGRYQRKETVESRGCANRFREWVDVSGSRTAEEHSGIQQIRPRLEFHSVEFPLQSCNLWMFESGLR
jgi:hypothetical protein